MSGSNILKISSQKSFGFTEVRFMEQKGVNWISCWIRESKINALNYQNSMFTFGGGHLALTCAADCSGYRCPRSSQKIALLFVQVTGHLVRHLNRCPTQPGHMYILVFIALK